MYIPLLIFWLLLQNICVAAQESPEFTNHIVRENENVYRISLLYGVPIDSVKRWNNLDAKYKILVGGNLKIRKQLIVSGQSIKIDKPTAETSLVVIPDTTNSLKNIRTIDSLADNSKYNYLPILSEPIVKSKEPYFFEKVLYFYFKTKYVFKTVLLLNLFFILSVIILLIVILFRRIKDGYINIRKSKCLDRYRDFITDWLYETHSPNVPESLLNELKDWVYRDVFTAELLSLHSNLTGDSADKLVKLFHLAGLKKYSIRKAFHSSWYVKAKGFRELAQMKITEESGLIFKYLNSRNDILRIEAQMAWIQLNPNDPLSFFDNPKVYLSEWGLLNSLVSLKKIDAVPDFGRWLSSLNKSVALFAIKMSGVFKQFDNVDRVTNRLDDSDMDIRQAAICALGKMAIPAPCHRLRQLFKTEEIINKSEIIRSLTMMSDSSNIPFFEEVMLNETDISLRILSAKGLVAIDGIADNRLNSLFGEADPVLKAIIIHAKDNRI